MLGWRAAPLPDARGCGLRHDDAEAVNSSQYEAHLRAVRAGDCDCVACRLYYRADGFICHAKMSNQTIQINNKTLPR